MCRRRARGLGFLIASAHRCRSHAYRPLDAPPPPPQTQKRAPATDAASESSSSSDEEDSEEDSEDEEAALLAELQRIKRERAEEAARRAAAEEAAAAKARQQELLTGNPLLAGDAGEPAFGVKRRWDDDVVFRGQARGEPKAQKRFINDTIRSDFHARFLKRYIR